MEETFASEFAKAKGLVNEYADKYLSRVWRTRLLYTSAGLVVGGIGGVFMPLVGLAVAGLCIYDMKREKPAQE